MAKFFKILLTTLFISGIVLHCITMEIYTLFITNMVIFVAKTWSVLPKIPAVSKRLSYTF